ARLEWLRKAVKQRLRHIRAENPQAKLADAQLALAREYRFRSWRALKAEVDRLQAATAIDASTMSDETVGAFLRAVGAGEIDKVGATLAAAPHLVNAVGPHPYWGGRPQALHVSIETKRRDMFDLWLASGADVNGSNEPYDHWSPLMLAVHWSEPDIRRVLIERDATIGLVEALMLGDDALVERLLRPGKTALPAVDPNDGSILAFARPPFPVGRLLELGGSTARNRRRQRDPT